MPRRPRLVAIWVLFAALFLTGPSPALQQPFSRTPANPASGPGRITNAIRDRAEKALDPGVPSDVAALLQGMTLGDASRLSRVERDRFRRASLTHLVAASGQNIALLAALVIPIFGALGFGLHGRLALTTGLILLYIPLAGGGPPITRAAIMALAVMAGRLRGSRTDAWHALGLAGVITLLLDPHSGSSLGWQLSFAAVAGMLSLGAWLEVCLERLRVPGALSEAAGATVSATAATTPLIAWRVGRLSVLGIPANLLAAPAVAPAMWLGLGAAAIGQVSSVAAAPLALVAAIPVSSVLEVADAMSAPSWSSVSWRPGGALAAGLLACVVCVPLLAQAGRRRS